MTGDPLRIAVLTPHLAAGPEVELQATAPSGTVTRVVRVSTESLGATAVGGPPSAVEARRLTEPPVLDDAAGRLAPTADVIGFASTSTGYAIGYDRERALECRLTAAAGVPVVSTCTSAVSGLRALDADSVALIDPRWFDAEVTDLGAAYVRRAGVDVAFAASADLAQDPDLIQLDDVIDWISRNVPRTAGAVFVAGNGFRAAAAVRALEDRLGRPVLTANQVLLWALLAHARTRDRINGQGALLAHDYPAG
jgi:maleate isomerase